MLHSEGSNHACVLKLRNKPIHGMLKDIFSFLYANAAEFLDCLSMACASSYLCFECSVLYEFGFLDPWFPETPSSCPHGDNSGKKATLLSLLSSLYQLRLGFCSWFGLCLKFVLSKQIYIIIGFKAFSLLMQAFYLDFLKKKNLWPCASQGTSPYFLKLF